MKQRILNNKFHKYEDVEKEMLSNKEIEKEICKKEISQNEICKKEISQSEITHNEKSKKVIAKNDFSKGSVLGNIIAQAVPLTIAQLIQLLYNVVDRMYLGRLEDGSSLALTGVGVTFPIIMLVSAFTSLFGMGGAPLCSIERGAGNKKKAEKIMGNSLMMLIVSALVLTVCGYIFMKPILYAFGASDVTYVYAKQYLDIYLLGTVFAMLSTGMNSFINSQGFPRVGMASVMIGAVINIILDPILIFGFDMGVGGAALATIVAQGVSALWVMTFLAGKKAVLDLKLENLIPDLKIIKDICSLGLSGFIMAGTNCLVQVVCNSTLKLYGGDLYVGVMTVISSVREIISLPINGITSGTQPVLGYNFGAKQYDRVRTGIVQMSIIGIVYTVFAWLMIFLFPEFFIRIFNDSEELVKAAVPALHMYFFGFFMMSLQFSGQSVFVSLGKSKKAVFFSLLRKAVIVAPLTVILPRIGGLGVMGVFLAEPISNAIGGLASFITMLVTVYFGELKRLCTQQT